MQNYLNRWRAMRQRNHWKNCLWHALSHYVKTDQFDKACRIIKRLNDPELMELALRARLLKSLVEALDTKES